MINESNYHIYLDEFVAGLLDEEMEMEFVAFLDQHPGILEGEILEDASVSLAQSFQTNLKKEIPLDAHHIDEYLIASLEGDLSPQQEIDLARFLDAHPEFEQNKSLVQLTKVDADTSLVYKNKSSLKKRPAIYLYTRWAASAAAVFILGMLVFRFLGGHGIPDNELADTPVPSINSIELPSIRVTGESIQENADQPNLSQTNSPGKLVAESPVPAQIQEVVPEQVKNQEVEFYALESPELPDLNLLPLTITASNVMPGEQLASNATELSVFQWAYKKLRGKVGVPEIVVPEREIPQDVANIVMAKVAPIFQVDPNGSGSRIRIGGIEINRRSAR